MTLETTQLWYVHVLLDCLRGTGGVHQLTFDTITDGHVDSPEARFLFEPELFPRFSGTLSSIVHALGRGFEP